MTRVCFVALHAYPLFDSRASGGIGGMETRAWLLARGLSQRSEMAVSFLVRDHGQLKRQRFGRVTVETYPGQMHAGPTFEPRVNPIYAQVGADIFVTFGVHWLSAEVVCSARNVGARSVVCVASDSDLSPEYRSRSTVRNAYGDYGNACHSAIADCDRVVVQTRYQEQLARAHFGRVDATMLPSPVPVGGSRLPTPRRRYVLWVGRSDPVFKRPQLCLELARRCPGIPFVVVMNRCDAKTHDQLEREAPPNVLLIDRVPFGVMHQYFADAAMLVNTSCTEGFPNVFLQAGAHGVPVLSLQADPDQILRSGAGWVADGDVHQLASDVQDIWHDPDRSSSRRRRFWDYVRVNHGLDRRVDQFRDELVDVVQTPREVAA